MRPSRTCTMPVYLTHLFFFLCTEQAGCLPVLTQLLMNPLLQLQSAVPEAAKKMYRDVCVATKINNRCPTGNEADVE